MEKLIMMRIEILEKLHAELENYKMYAVEEVEKGNSERCIDLARVSKCEFMQNILKAIEDYDLFAEEAEILMDTDDFLEQCWQKWIDTEGTLDEVIEETLEDLAEEKAVLEEWGESICDCDDEEEYDE